MAWSHNAVGCGVSLIWFHLEVTCLLLGILGFSSPKPAAHVDSNFLRIAPNPASLTTVKDASDFLAQLPHSSHIPDQVRLWVPAAAATMGRDRKPIAIG